MTRIHLSACCRTPRGSYPIARTGSRARRCAARRKSPSCPSPGVVTRACSLADRAAVAQLRLGITLTLAASPHWPDQLRKVVACHLGLSAPVLWAAHLLAPPGSAPASWLAGVGLQGRGLRTCFVHSSAGLRPHRDSFHSHPVDYLLRFPASLRLRERQGSLRRRISSRFGLHARARTSRDPSPSHPSVLRRAQPTRHSQPSRIPGIPGMAAQPRAPCGDPAPAAPQPSTSHGASRVSADSVD